MLMGVVTGVILPQDSATSFLHVATTRKALVKRTFGKIYLPLLYYDFNHEYSL